MSNHVYIAASLDGYIADRNDGLEWLMALPNPDNSDLGFGQFIEGIDAIVMGRRTFETVCGFGGEWPYPRPTFVLSSTLESVPEPLADRVEVISGQPRTIVDSLAERGFKELYIDGGQVIQAFLREDLIDELTLSRIPVLLGGGVSLFGELPGHLEFEPMHTELLIDKVVKTHYRRGRQQVHIPV